MRSGGVCALAREVSGAGSAGFGRKDEELFRCMFPGLMTSSGSSALLAARGLFLQTNLTYLFRSCPPRKPQAPAKRIANRWMALPRAPALAREAIQYARPRRHPISTHGENGNTRRGIVSPTNPANSCVSTSSTAQLLQPRSANWDCQASILASLAAREISAGKCFMTFGSAFSAAKGSRSASRHCRKHNRSVLNSMTITARASARSARSSRTAAGCGDGAAARTTSCRQRRRQTTR